MPTDPSSLPSTDHFNRTILINQEQRQFLFSCPTDIDMADYMERLFTKDQIQLLGNGYRLMVEAVQ
jgi:hypothetical protein